MSNTHSNDDRHATPDETNPDATIGAAPGDPDGGSTLEKDPETWVTGDEPMTGAQRSYLDTLAREAGETLRADLTKAEASEEIDRLQSGSDRA